jgi:carrier protein
MCIISSCFHACERYGLFSVAYIKSVDGFVGCYRGLGPKLCAYTISSITHQKVHEQIKFENDSVAEIDEETTERKR